MCKIQGNLHPARTSEMAKGKQRKKWVHTANMHPLLRLRSLLVHHLALQDGH